MTSGLVIVLGKTGRNFAAGMTGGVAYVFDQSGEFASECCNRADVDLEPVTDSKDVELLHRLLTRHAELTGSPQGKWALKHWDAVLPKFVKVFPHEFKRVLGIPRIPATVLAAQAGTMAAQGQVIRG
jgi:glutamate synthase domain-containing protein 3